VLIVFLLAQLAAPPLTAEAVVEALNEPGCPRVFELLGPRFQKAVPRDAWPPFCDAVGRLTDLRPQPSEDEAQVFHANSPKGEVELQIAITRAGKVSGLTVKPWRGPSTPSTDSTEAPTEQPTSDHPSTDDPRDLAGRLTQIAARHKVPALGVLLVIDGEVRAHQVVGVRKQGDPTPATKDDLWHLGSDTKAMTAMLAAMVVDSGKWTWATTVPELFPGVKVHPGYEDVTLSMLLRHRGGVIPNIKRWPMEDARQRAVEALLAEPPGKKGVFSYSNASYIMVGAAIERALGGTWEALLTKKLFEPLEMRTCGFGVMAHAPKVDQPWPHKVEGGVPVPVYASPDADNHPGLGPAGTVSCSLADWAKFVGLFARGDPKGLVTPESFAELQRFEDGYAGAGAPCASTGPRRSGSATRARTR
jgi:CubicO group peptidase (beta-lactamase class C family)